MWVDNTPSPCSEIAEHTYTGQGTSTHQQMSRTRQTRRTVAKLNPHVVPFPGSISLDLAAMRSILEVCGTFKVSRSDPDWRQLKLPPGLPSEPLPRLSLLPPVNKQQQASPESLSSPSRQEIHLLSGDNPPDRQEKIILVGGEKSWRMKRKILLAGEDEILLFEETGEGPLGGKRVGRGVGSRW